MSKKLDNRDYCEAAEALGCEFAAVKAIAKVESAGDGFLPSGKVKILFERHHFSRFTQRKFDAKYPNISSRQAGGYAGNEKEYQRFNAAFALDAKAAMLSTSWGKFQIMGFNYAVCGFRSVGEFVDAMKKGEAEQLRAFLEFVKENNLDDELRRKDWKGFARGYNGSAYAKNQYDVKMANAYAQYKREGIDCAKLLLEDNDILEIPPLPQATERVKNEQMPQDFSGAGGTWAEPEKPATIDLIDQSEPILDIKSDTEPPATETTTTTTIETPQGEATTETVQTNTQPLTEKEQEAPAKEGSTATATGITIFGFSLTAVATLLQQWLAQGQIDVKAASDLILKFFTENTRYFFYCVMGIILIILVKKIFKQLTFLVVTVINANPNWHDIKIVAPVEEKRGFFRRFL